MQKIDGHYSECHWAKTTELECEYKATHYYCPHPEHACTCKDIERTESSIPQTSNQDEKRAALVDDLVRQFDNLDFETTDVRNFVQARIMPIFEQELAEAERAARIDELSALGQMHGKDMFITIAGEDVQEVSDRIDELKVLRPSHTEQAE